ncbi:MAG: YkoP family protein [Caulobacteraceae bacterium]
MAAAITEVGLEAPEVVVTPRPPASTSDQLRRLILATDRMLRRAQGVFEFSASDRCLLRISIIPAPETVRLCDGVKVERGESVVALHLWNEHLPYPPGEGPSLAWASFFRRQMLQSFSELSARIEASPDLKAAKAIRVRIGFASRRRGGAMKRIGARLGFETLSAPGPKRAAKQLHRVLEGIWIWGLVWAFNPGGLKRRAFIGPYDELWMSAQAFVQRFGDPVKSGIR